MIEIIPIYAENPARSEGSEPNKNVATNNEKYIIVMSNPHSPPLIQVFMWEVSFFII